MKRGGQEPSARRRRLGRRNAVQRPARQSREDRQRARFPVIRMRRGQVQCLLQHVLAGHDRMRGLVRKAHPYRTRRKRHRFLRTGALVLQVALHAVVQLQHQVVVLAAKGLGHTQRLQHLGLPRRIRLGAWQELTRHGLEGLTHAPHTGRPVGVDVGNTRRMRSP